MTLDAVIRVQAAYQLVNWLQYVAEARRFACIIHRFYASGTWRAYPW